MNAFTFNPMNTRASAEIYTDLNSVQNIRQAETPEALRQVSQQFESLFVQMMLKNMRAANAVFSEDNPFDSRETQFYRDMHDQQLALTLAHGRGIGIADALYKQLSQQYLAEPDTSEKSATATFRKLADGIAPQLSSVSIDVQKPSSDEAQGPVAKVSAFIHKMRAHAVDAAQQLGVDAAVLIAQAALETGWGEHVLKDKSGRSSNNLFNIKAHSEWAGKHVQSETMEFLGGKFAKVVSNFRAYDSVADSFSDYVRFIGGSERYDNAAADSGSALAYIKKIHEAGYATDPDYVQKVMSVYQRVRAELEDGGAHEF